MRSALVMVGALVVSARAMAGGSFVNWESPHVSPLDMTPNGSRLLAVNTPDNRLEIFDVSGAGLSHVASVPVGVDPVSVRARTNTEAWVVNHISDTISIVDLTTLNVIATIYAVSASGVVEVLRCQEVIPGLAGGAFIRDGCLPMVSQLFERSPEQSVRLCSELAGEALADCGLELLGGQLRLRLLKPDLREQDRCLVTGESPPIGADHPGEVARRQR